MIRASRFGFLYLLKLHGVLSAVDEGEAINEARVTFFTG